MSPPHIRPAQPADEPFIVDCNCRLAAETENKQLDRPTVTLGVRAVLADPRKGRYFIAESDGQPCGQLMHTYEWSDWRNGDIWWIQSVFVAAACRRRGVFRTLYEHVRAAALADPQVVGLRLYVEQHNDRALETYRRLGLQPAGYHVLEDMLRRQV